MMSDTDIKNHHKLVKDLENKNIEQAILKNKDMRKTIEQAKSILGKTI